MRLNILILTFCAIALATWLSIFGLSGTQLEAEHMTSDFDINHHLNGTPSVHVVFATDKIIHSGPDRQLIVVFSVPDDSTAWLTELPERRGNFIVPKEVAEFSTELEADVVRNPKDAAPVLASNWSQGFLAPLSNDTWLLVAETN